MALSKPPAACEPSTDFVNLTEEHCTTLLSKYIKNSINIRLLDLSVGFRPETSESVASEIVSNLKEPAVVIIAKRINGTLSEEDEEKITPIQELQNRVKDLQDHLSAFLLVSLPLNMRQPVTTKRQTIIWEWFEGPKRNDQMNKFIKDHPKIREGKYCNAAKVEVLNIVDLLSVLNEFVEKLALPHFESLHIIFNGHGSKEEGHKGDLKLDDGNRASMISILEALQIFRLQLLTAERKGPLPELHIVFAQCHTYHLDWKAALQYNLIDDVVWLTWDKDRYRQTMNEPLAGALSSHVQLTQLIEGTMFPSLKAYKKRYSQAPKAEIQELANHLDQLQIDPAETTREHAKPTRGQDSVDTRRENIESLDSGVVDG